MKQILHIGFDDTDSLKGSCTTHLATTLINEIFDQVVFLDFPNLIRLNPNIPYKTRGNGAVAIRVKGLKEDLDFCKEMTHKLVKKMARIEDENTNPGIVFVENKIPKEVVEFSQRAMWSVLTIKEAEGFQNFDNISLEKFGNGRGIIGALGAIGNTLQNDFTYEHLSYREENNFGKKRMINEESVFIADKETPLTFSNIDYEYNAIMITPRGADPVFSGIRGETVEAISKAWALIDPLEPIAMKMIFRTNQHTNEHFVKEFKISELEPHLSIISSGEVSKNPHYIEGSHLIFSFKDDTGEIDAAAYEPTKRFRGEISNLKKGDKITVFSGVRPQGNNHPMTVNIERLIVNELITLTKSENPFCDKCGARLKSAGKNKGFKCPKCSTIYRDKKPTMQTIPRKINKQEYLPPIVAHRHLTRPIVRNDRNNTGTQLSLEETEKILRELVKYNKDKLLDTK